MFTEEMPEYPGGMTILLNYLSKELQLPHLESVPSCTGRYYISFIIEKDGSPSEIKLAHGTCGEKIDNAVLKPFYGMDKWIPGKKDGKEVRVRFKMPLNINWK